MLTMPSNVEAPEDAHGSRLSPGKPPIFKIITVVVFLVMLYRFENRIRL